MKPPRQYDVDSQDRIQVIGSQSLISSDRKHPIVMAVYKLRFVVFAVRACLKHMRLGTDEI